MKLLDKKKILKAQVKSSSDYRYIFLITFNNYQNNNVNFLISIRKLIYIKFSKKIKFIKKNLFIKFCSLNNIKDKIILDDKIKNLFYLCFKDLLECYNFLLFLKINRTFYPVLILDNSNKKIFSSVNTTIKLYKNCELILFYKILFKKMFFFIHFLNSFCLLFLRIIKNFKKK